MGIKKHNTVIGLLFLGYGFLYLPIITLVIFSFNSNKSVMKWGAFSLKWYKKLFHNQVIIEAALLSVKIAIITAFIAIVIGGIAAIIMVRFQKFKGKTFFNGLVTAPLIMHDVIVGLSLLIFFVSTYNILGWPSSRGVNTIVIGHTTMAIAYIILILRSRLLEFDISLEEAAMDLGAKPITVFFKITLPIIRPAIASGGLLAFTLSFDDVVLASFLGGSGATTLPIIVFSSVKNSISPEINALATIFITIMTISVIIAGILVQRHKRITGA